MKCAVHPEVDATGFCRNCGKAMCSVCARPVREVLYCGEGRVRLEIVEHDLIEAVAVGVMRVRAIVPTDRAETEYRRAVTIERRVVRSARCRRAASANRQIQWRNRLHSRFHSSRIRRRL